MGTNHREWVINGVDVRQVFIEYLNEDWIKCLLDANDWIKSLNDVHLREPTIRFHKDNYVSFIKQYSFLLETIDELQKEVVRLKKKLPKYQRN